ncbi:MAG: carboxypeptidase regulatory-like domain-containing protein [Gemmatimonadales bacterium]|nr:carboxypeptidase regulatory-like domain-containing protein [Gemmatimonadales bacterium]
MTMKIERRNMLRVTLATALALVFPTAVLAQDGAITGTVINEEGLAMPTVTVTATGAPLGDESRTAMTSAQGVYTITGLPAGTYSLRFTLPGFVEGVSSGVVVQAGERTNVDMQMASQRTIALEELTAVVTGSHFSAPPENLPYAVDVTDRESLREKGAPQAVDFFKKLGCRPRHDRRAQRLVQPERDARSGDRDQRQSARPGRLANVDAVERSPPGVHPGQTSRRPVRGHQRLSRHRARPYRSPEGGRLGHLRLRRRSRRGQLCDTKRLSGIRVVRLA